MSRGQALLSYFSDVYAVHSINYVIVVYFVPECHANAASLR